MKLICLFCLDGRLPNDDEVATSQAARNLEAFQRIAQAHAERERFLPGAAGVLHGGINAAATIAAQGLTGSASDYMRLAMPVRDPDGGDAISGSGKKPTLVDTYPGLYNLFRFF